MNNIRTLGMEDDTLVILVSDHGSPMGKGEHGHGIMRKCRPWPYEELVHVPLIMPRPRHRRRQAHQEFVQNVDVTAVFAAASVHISSTGKAVLGDSYTFTAKLGGKHLTADSIRWYANGVEVRRRRARPPSRWRSTPPCSMRPLRCTQWQATTAAPLPATS